jgi:hypothetical protein
MRFYRKQQSVVDVVSFNYECTNIDTIGQEPNLNVNVVINTPDNKTTGQHHCNESFSLVI